MSASPSAFRQQARIVALEAVLRPQLDALGLARQAVQSALEGADYFSVLEHLIPQRGRAPAEALKQAIASLEELLRIKTFAHPALTGGLPLVPVVFGTGGHRGEIGRGLTLVHIHAIIQALLAQIAGLDAAGLRQHFNSDDLAEVKRKGFVIGHDNRLFNPDFALYTAHLLQAAGYRVWYAGRVATPELSRVGPIEGWAGALNFTPSHNPFRYGGIKFNPADGGLAGNDLTDPLAEEANRLLAASQPAAWPAYVELDRLVSAQGARTETVDVHEIYIESLRRHPIVRLDELVQTIRALPAGERLRWMADPVWGGAVPIYQRLQQLLGADVLGVLHTEDDAYFGGQTTEPNEQTLGEALAGLKASPARHKVAIRNDPDGDRGLVGDEGGAIKMNRFAALVMRYLIERGTKGEIATTLPTSRLGVAYARAHRRSARLTAVGFKNFRPYLASGEAMLAYEESDGMTIAGHTLDKDGVLAGLMAVRIVLHYRRPLNDLLAEIENEVGHYHWRQENFPVEVSAAQVRERLTQLAHVQPGSHLEGEGLRLKVKAVDARDGYHFEFEDGSWLMMRPSGTEPKVRVYAETCEGPEATQRLCAMGKALALRIVRGA
ncbi:MAG: hypothetical protein HY423_13165 [Candidatus Lambdaproteobacteria bacterium]|nr:hypothetical protein [Candidatus Lambdaproteobacteria bacterium]